MRQMYPGVIGDMKNLEHHFSLMAEQGWMIDKIGLFTHHYHAVEPCKKHFFVDILPQITAFDYPENDDAQDYRRICKESGWDFIAANKQFHVFCADGENPSPIPIHTDNKIQAQIYLKTCRKYELPWLIYALFMLCFTSPLGRGAEIFLSNMTLFMALGYCFFIVAYLWVFVFVIRWYLRTRRSAKNDLPLPIVNYRLARLRFKIFAVGTFMFLLCSIVGFTLEVINGMPITFLFVMLMPISAVGVGLWIRRKIDTKRRTRAGNIGFAIITIVIMEIVFLAGMWFMAQSIISLPLPHNSDSLGNLPVITLNDVGLAEEPDHSDTTIKGTFTVPLDYEYRESSSNGTVNIRVYRSINKTLTRWLYEHLSEEFADRFAYRLDDSDYLQESLTVLSSDEADFWGAEKGISFNYANSNTVELLLCEDKSILRITARSEDMDLDTIGQAVREFWEKLN